MNESEQTLYDDIQKLLEKHKATLEPKVSSTIGIFRDGHIILASQSLESPDLAEGDILRSIVKNVSWSVKIPQIEETTK